VTAQQQAAPEAEQQAAEAGLNAEVYAGPVQHTRLGRS